MKTGIVICSRVNSKRVYKKPLQRIGLDNKTLIEHLCNDLSKLDIPIVVAIPQEDIGEYSEVITNLKNKVSFFYGYANDPLQRMYKAASFYGFETVIRVTHDKLFLDKELILYCLEKYKTDNAKYLFSSHFIDGTGFEIIDFKILQKAAYNYENVEHISYAIRTLTKDIINLNLMGTPYSYHAGCEHRFLIDYPEDVYLMNELFIKFGQHLDLKTAIKYLDNNKSLASCNRLPMVTFYTCVKNGQDYLEECIRSIVMQNVFKSSEYLIINDHSTDGTIEIISKYKLRYPNIRIFTNWKNKGLASSSNIALKYAKGKFIVRLDHDDYFVGNNTVREMIKDIRIKNADILYPHNYYGNLTKLQLGREQHHIGGTLFRTRSINFIKFTENLKNYDGLDFFKRAHKVLRIGYFEKAAFFYRQRSDSMSKTNLAERERVKRELDESTL